MTEKTKPRKLTPLQEGLLEITRDFVAGGITPVADLEKLTLRLLGKDAVPQAAELTSNQIKRLRERANVSQAVLAAHIGVTAGYLSRLERGEARPSPPVARLLDLVRRKGIDAIL